MEFEKWKDAFSVDAEGTTENESQDDGQGLLHNFVEYIKVCRLMHNFTSYFMSLRNITYIIGGIMHNFASICGGEVSSKEIEASDMVDTFCSL